MPTLEGLRKKIDTATDLNSVVSTMKTLAAVSIRQYERAVEALDDYNRNIEMGFHILLRQHPFQIDRGETTGETGAVVFGSDQGMCGQFNEEIVSFVREKQQEAHPERPWRLLVVGVRAEGQLLDAGLPVHQTYQAPTSVSDITNLVQEMLPQIEHWRETFNVGELRVFHNRRVSASSYQPRQLHLLPLDRRLLEKWRQEPWQSRSLPTFRTSPELLLSRLVQQYLFVSLFRTCAESLASENAARIAAMQAAENNIEERLAELQGAFNQLRQNSITEELMDVVTGFEALAKKRSERD